MVNPNANGWGVLAAAAPHDSEEYLARIRTDYKFRLQEDYIFYSLDMLIDPCRDATKTGGLGEECCFETNLAGCQRYGEIVAGADLQIAFFANAHIPTCRGTEFARDPNCGTYIEVHRPWVNQILSDVSIDADQFPNGYRTTRIATHRLCLGDYELWWVVRTRSGPYVQQTRKFFVRGPSCPAPEGEDALPPDLSLPRPRIP